VTYAEAAAEDMGNVEAAVAAAAGVSGVAAEGTVTFPRSRMFRRRNDALRGFFEETRPRTTAEGQCTGAPAIAKEEDDMTRARKLWAAPLVALARFAK